VRANGDECISMEVPVSKIMKSLPMSELLARIVGEWAARDSAYDIPGALTRRVLEIERRSPGFSVNGLAIGLPVGPAAGPHTQIAPNLVAAWLQSGGWAGVFAEPVNRAAAPGIGGSGGGSPGAD